MKTDLGPVPALMSMGVEVAMNIKLVTIPPCTLAQQPYY